MRKYYDDFDVINGRATYPKSSMPRVNRDPRLADMTVRVTRFVTDVDGNIINKNTLPIGMQVSYAYMLFGEFDRQGGYKVAQQVVPVQGISEYIGTFVFGKQEGFLQFNTQGDVYNQMLPGDIYHMYTDSTVNPNFFIFMVIANPFAAMGSITSATAWHLHTKSGLKGKLDIEHFKLITETNAQYSAPISLIGLDNIGVNKSDSINPLASRSIDDKQPDFIQIDIPLKIDQFTGLVSFIRFDADAIIYQFKLRY